MTTKNEIIFACAFAARTGSRTLQGVQPSERANAITVMADLLLTKQNEIVEANNEDVAEATKQGLAKPLLSRLSLTPAKIKSLAAGKCKSNHVRKGICFIRLLCK